MTTEEVELGEGAEGSCTTDPVSCIKSDHCLTIAATYEADSSEESDEETGQIRHEGHDDKPEQSPEAALVNEDEKDTSRSVLDIAIEYIKYIYSTVLLVFCVVVVHAAIFTNQTVATGSMGIPPPAAFCIFWFLLCWLATMEGGQGALVGLQPVDKSLYATTHPHTLKNTNLVHKGDNMDRFIVGRQYLVVLVITMINMLGSCIGGASVFGFPVWMNDIFLATGVAMILTTIVIGHLTAQVNAANCMLDFINNHFMLFTSYVSLGIEFSGLLHCVYLVKIIFAEIIREPIKSPPRSTFQSLFFWARVIMSVVILGFCLAVTMVALFDGKTGMWEGVPPSVSIIILFVLMAIVGFMEGTQIALFAVINLPDEEIELHRVAHKNCQLAFAGTNLQAFLIGRQIFVATCMFVVARIATPVYLEEDPNIWGVSDGFQSFLNTGLTGAVITTIIGSLAWRIVASSGPLAFLSNPLIYVLIKICLIVEASGICSSAWVLGSFNKVLCNYQRDEVYLKGAEREACCRCCGGV